MGEISLTQTIEQSFGQYAGAVIQSRALVDVRDCVKPSARQIYYSLFTDGFTANNNFKKTLKAIGSTMRFYIHGDSSCEGIIMRSAQPFAMRYPLVEVEGSYGNSIESGNWAAPRYTASRLSPLADYLLQETNQNTIEEWVDNYDDTEKYPFILSSLGFYNIVNGSMGIGVGLASSVPQFNLKEVNNAMITLLKKPNASFEEIYCAPDFATGGFLINKEEVKISLEVGEGKPCILRANYIYNKKERTITITELPYGVYTNTICSEIDKLVQNNSDCGIVGINDLTGSDVKIKIYIDKKASEESIMDFLYQNTSLQKAYSINMTMLEQGRYPKVFSWRDCLVAHLEHERTVYTQKYRFELEKSLFRFKILCGIIKAIENTEEIIKLIKNSTSTKEAKNVLQNYLDIDEDQAEAILNIKLSRLAHLESDKIIREKEELEKSIETIRYILESPDELTKKMIERLEEVAEKYGDDRRTKLDNIVIEKQKETKKEKVIFPVTINIYEDGRIKPSKADNSAINTIATNTSDRLMLFTSAGKVHNTKVVDKLTKLELEDGEKVLAADSFNIDNPPYTFVCFITKKGMFKKTLLSEYKAASRNGKSAALKLKEGDKVVSVLLMNEESVYLKTKNNLAIHYDTNTISSVGKGAAGVIGMKVAADDEVVVGRIAPRNCKLAKQNRGGKGKKVDG